MRTPHGGGPPYGKARSPISAKPFVPAHHHHIETMTDLIIGLLVGVASAIAIGVMWRMTDRLRDELNRDEAVHSKAGAQPSDPADRPQRQP
jgi:hypothetical protein